MRLVFLSNYYPPHHIGGYEELCQDVAEGLLARGHAVAVLTSRGPSQDESSTSLRVLRRLLLEVDASSLGARIDSYFRAQRRLKSNLQVLQDTMSEFSPDLTMVWAMWNLPSELPVALERQYGMPVVYYLADYWPTLPSARRQHWEASARRRYLSGVRQTMGRWILRGLPRTRVLPQFRHALCVSAYVRKRLIESGIPLQDAQIVHNGIRLAPFVQAGRERIVREGEPRLLYAGRLSREKGVETAIRAVGTLRERGHHPSLTLLGGGEGGYVAELERLVRDSNLADQVSFAGKVPRERVPEVLRGHDVLIVPSVWPEPLPRTIQEGMAARLAVVASRVGGIPEIVHDGVNGLTFEPGDADGLASRLYQLAIDPRLRQSLAEMGAQTVQGEFDLERMLDRIEAQLEAARLPALAFSAP